ncbi:alpha/beta fold hydrolase [Catenuloplanes atrovinosus]|uniref:Pimeloyl-ACP methyl ester carboxylesterase n=1 Tax=Catenuloplanes atrovinosus TaxID=137266 RepID=A0AAE3YN07_9ACTN|nr:alpha/beta fold hydrolase [Catenuloplanes atrovinosus]MDR7275154.1 pimeloyl-ACP methyl ester carboxylesterase [Catenuloplanes atrovinosus]
MAISTGTVDAGGVTIAFRTAGDAGAPPVVLLHGGGSRAATWDAFAMSLAAAGQRAIALDLRGHGGSARTRDYPLAAFRDDVLAAMDALGLGRVSLVGHSLGGHTATLVAQAAPDRVGRLVLEDPPAPSGTAGVRSLPARQLLLPWVGMLVRRGGFDGRALAAAVRQLRAPDPGWWDRVPLITAPTLVIGGGPRSHVSAERLAALARALPDGRLLTIPAGHRVHSTAPAAFQDAVLPFLTTRP